MSGFRQWILDIILAMVDSFDRSVDQATAQLSVDLFTGAMYNMAYNIATTVIRPIALTVIAICFIIEFLKITMRMDILKWEFALRVAAKLVLARAAMDLSFYLLSAIYATGVEWVVGAGAVGSTLGEEVTNALNGIMASMTWYQALGLVATMGIAFLVIWVIGIIVVVVAFARSFEILLYVAVSPLPCAFLPLEDSGGSRIAKKFFLSFAGVCLQGLLIILSIRLYGALCDSTLNAAVGSGDFSSITYNMLLGAVVLAVCVVKSGSLAKSILDAI